MLPEFVLLLLQYLYSSERQDFLSCMRVCKSWHDLAVPLLWTNIALTDQQSPSHGCLRAFVDIAVSGKGQRSQVRSLTASRPRRNNLVIQGLREIYELIRHTSLFPNLRSFSYHFIASAAILQRAQIAGAFNHSSISLKSFELSGDFTDSGFACIRKCVFYSALAQFAYVLPQLHHIRLNGFRVCPGFFEAMTQTCPELLDISIVMTRDFCRCSCEVDKHAFDQLGTPARLVDNTIDDILKAAKKVVDQGRLPKIKKFTIIGRLHKTIAQPSTFQNLYKADILRCMLTSYPTANGNLPDELMWMRYKSQECSEVTDLFAAPSDLVELVEETGWVTYNNHARLHKDIHAPSYLRQQPILKWYAQAVSAGEVRRAQPAELFFWEDRVGRPLLHVQTSQELIVPQVIEREHPSEELFMEPGSDLAKAWEAYGSSSYSRIEW